jgi:hypothetical protein
LRGGFELADGLVVLFQVHVDARQVGLAEQHVAGGLAGGLRRAGDPDQAQRDNPQPLSCHDSDYVINESRMKLLGAGRKRPGAADARRPISTWATLWPRAVLLWRTTSYARYYDATSCTAR